MGQLNELTTFKFKPQYVKISFINQNMTHVLHAHVPVPDGPRFLGAAARISRERPRKSNRHCVLNIFVPVDRVSFEFACVNNFRVRLMRFRLEPRILLCPIQE